MVYTKKTIFLLVLAFTSPFMKSCVCCGGKSPERSQSSFRIANNSFDLIADTSRLGGVSPGDSLINLTYNQLGDTAEFGLWNWKSSGIFDVKSNFARITIHSIDSLKGTYYANQFYGHGTIDIAYWQKNYSLIVDFTLVMSDLSDTSKQIVVSGQFRDDAESCHGL
jgi:hypothetical protein